MVRIESVALTSISCSSYYQALTDRSWSVLQAIFKNYFSESWENLQRAIIFLNIYKYYKQVIHIRRNIMIFFRGKVVILIHGYSAIFRKLLRINGIYLLTSLIQLQMKSKLDICHLYQQKYINNTPPRTANLPSFSFKQQILHKYGQFSQRLYSLKEKTSIKPVRITVNNNGFKVTKQKSHSIDLIDQSKQVAVRKNQVHQSQYRKSDFLRQMMKLSHQQLGDLQNSVGGQNKLLKTLKCFFQRRNKTMQQQKAKTAKSGFRVVGGNTQRYSHRVIYSRERQQNKRNQIEINLGIQEEKDIAPWHIEDIQGQ